MNTDISSDIDQEQDPRHDWSFEDLNGLFVLPFLDLLFKAQLVHRKNFPANEVQLSTLISLKTGKCSEDCSYCSQSAHHTTDSPVEPLLDIEKVLSAAAQAKMAGANRFCMGSSGRGPNDGDLQSILEMVRKVKSLGLETCLTLGMLTDEQAQDLKNSGLDYYNHNLDTSPEYYGEIVTTHTYQERLDTLTRVRKAGISLCSGGILGLGEGRTDRIGLLLQLANMPKHPESVPINMLVQIEGTPLEDRESLDTLEFVRTIAVARIVMPRSMIRLSAGREEMSEEMHALSFLAGANSVFFGDKLLTTDNTSMERDKDLFTRLGMVMADNKMAQEL